MSQGVNEIILNYCSADYAEKLESIQSLWSGYGEIARYKLTGSEFHTVIVKHIQLPAETRHPRGWNTNLSHERKVRSYDVELHFYNHYISQCDEYSRVAKNIACVDEAGVQLIIMEDLDAAGYDLRLSRVDMQDVQACLSWLANFHAQFMGVKPKGLWDVGTYWHLATRPDELKVMPVGDLRDKAQEIDQLLNDCRYQSFVHGDAKLANFCFSNDGRVAAVDFQYVGGGCGMKDVVYFLGSCLSEDECEEFEDQLLDYYFHELEQALKRLEKDIDFTELQKEWRSLFALAWTDFFRFLQGWSPGHWKINSYSTRLAEEVLERL